MNKVQYKGNIKIIIRLRDAVNALIDGKQDVLTYDQKPVADSTNAISSGAVYAAIADLKKYVDERTGGDTNG